MSDFSGKIVLVTGAGRGLGRVLAGEFAAQGAMVALNDLTLVNLDEVVAEIEDSGGRVKSYLADIAIKVALQTMITDILEDWGRIDILINHANVQPKMALLDMDEWDWRRTIDVNLTGAFLMMQSVGRVMRELGGGVIVNIGAREQDDSKLELGSAYMSAKNGLLALTRSAARELAQHNIRVNAVCQKAGDLKGAAQKVLSLCSEDDERTGQILNCV